MSRIDKLLKVIIYTLFISIILVMIIGVAKLGYVIVKADSSQALITTIPTPTLLPTPSTVYCTQDCQVRETKVCDTNGNCIKIKATYCNQSVGGTCKYTFKSFVQCN